MRLIDVKALAELLLEKHGLNDWRFEFNRAKKRFGFCRPSAKLISTSQHLALLNDESILTNHLLHEIAHALVGASHGHDYVWKRKAMEIGCNGERCYTPENAGGDVKSVTAPWKAVCPCCGIETTRFRAPKLGKREACRACCTKYNFGRFDPRFVFVFKRV